MRFQSSDEAIVERLVRIPPLASYFVPRKRLNDVVDRLSSAKMSIVVAPCGAGKTTLLAGWCREQEEKGVCCLWVSVVEGIYQSEPLLIWNYLLRALAKRWPLLPDALEESSFATHDQAARTMGNVLYRIMQDDPEKCVIVIDDIDNLGAADATAVLEAIDTYFPDDIRVIALSVEITATTVARARSKGVSQIHPEKLLFTEDELSQVWSAIVGHPVKASLVSDFMDIALGWPQASAIYGSALASGEILESDPFSVDTLCWLLDDFFEHQYFGWAREGLLDRFAAMSLMDVWNAELLDYVFERDDGQEIIEELASHQVIRVPVVAFQAVSYYPVVRHWLVRR